MNKQYNNFGEFLHDKRIENNMSYRALAEKLGVTPAYISDIEKNRRNAPSIEKLEKIKTLFILNNDEINLMYDLAGQTKGDIPPDILEMLQDNKAAILALRTSKDCNAKEEDWLHFVEELKKKN